MELKGKKVLVTGAGGFIGSHLVDALLAEGANIRCFVRYRSTGSAGFIDDLPADQRARVEIVKGDLTDSDAVRKAMQGVDVVFHLAAMIAIPHSYDMPRETVQVNVIGTLNVLVAARDANVKRIVHTSTSEVYGTAKSVPITEEHALQGQSPYSASKIAADKLAESFHCAYGLPVVTVRPFNTFGPRQSSRAVIPTIITQVLTQDAVKLGTVSTTRDFLYVKDTVQGFIAAAKSDKAIGQTINLGTGREISIGDIAKIIMKAAEKELPVVSDQERIRPENSEVFRLCASTKKAHELLEWSPKYTFEQGLVETIAWITDNLEYYRVGEYTK